MIGRVASPKKQIRVLSKADMDREMKRIQDLFKKKESEETWAQFDQALKNIKVWATADNIYQYPGFVDHIKLLQRPIISSLTSDRTRLSGTASDLLQALSQAMKRRYEIIHELFMPTLIQLFSRSNKVQLQNTLNCFKAIVQHSKVPRTTHRLCSILKNNKDSSNNTSKSTRYHVTECLNTVIQINATTDLLRYVDDIEAAIRNTAMDPAPEVRSSIRMCYKLYCEKIPDQASKFSKTLTPEVSRYLQVTTAHRTSLSAGGSKSTLGKRSATSTTASPERLSKKRHVASPTSSTSLKTGRTTPSTVKSASATTLNSRRKPALAPSTATSTRNMSTSSSTTTKQKASPSLLPRPKASTASYLAATTSSAAKKTTLSLTPNLRTKYLAQNDNNLQLQPDYRLESRTYIRGKPPMRQKKSSQQTIEVAAMENVDTSNGNDRNPPLIPNSVSTSTVGKRTSTVDEVSQQEDLVKTQD